jgi:hypothetical protein
LKRILPILAFCLLSAWAFSKGTQGTYTIVGIAYTPDSISLKNVELTVTIGDKTTVIKTNDQGGFSIDIKWSTACGTKLTPEQEKEEAKKLNPEYIYVSYKGKN